MIRANAGDDAAVAALYERCKPRLHRWAHNRLPPAARGAPANRRSGAGHAHSRAYPVEGSTRTEVEREHLRSGRHIPLRDVQPDLPDSFVRVVERAVAERPGDRYQSAGELEAALSATLMPEPKSWWKEIAAAAVVLLILGGAGLIWRAPDQPGATTASDTTAPAAARAAPVPASYRIKAVLNRARDGTEVPLTPGARLAPSERLSMALNPSAPARVYVVNEDERGNSLLLFPLPGREPSNPLPAGQHRGPCQRP